MTEERATVRLMLAARDYLATGAAVDAMNRRMQASQRALGNESEVTGRKLTGLAETAERSGRRTQRGLLYAGIGLASLGAGGAAIKFLPATLAATATAGAALPGILGGAANSALVLKLGMTGVGKVLGEIYKAPDPFSRLAPNAQRLAMTAEKLRPTLLGVQRDLQNRVTRGTGADLELLATKVLPQVRGELNALADDWAGMFAEIALGLSDPAVVHSWETVLGGADQFFDGIARRIRPTMRSLAGLAEMGQPVADQVGRSLMAMLDRFNAAVARAKQTGSLAGLFEAGAQSARELAQISGDVLRIIGMVSLEVSRQDAKIGTAADGLNRYLASGKAAEDIAGIVHTLTVAYEGLAATLGPLAGLVRDALADPGTANSLREMFAVLSAGSQTLEAILRLFLAFNNVALGVPGTLIAVAFAASKLRAGLAAVDAADVKGAASLGRYEGAVGRAGSKLPALATGARRVTNTLFGLAVVGAIADQFHEAANATTEFTTALAEIDKGGGSQSALAKLYGDDLKRIPDDVDRLKRAGGLKGLGKAVGFEQAIPGFSSFFDALDASQTNLQVRLQGLDQVFSQIAKSQGPKAAEQALAEFAAQTGLTGEQVQTLRDGMPQFTAAMRDGGDAAATTADGFGTAAQRAKLLKAGLDEIVFAGQSVLDVFNKMNGKALSVAESEIAANRAAKDFAKTLAGNGLGLNSAKTDFNLRTTSGQDNAEKLIAEAKAAAEHASAVKDETGSINAAARAYQEYVNQIRAALLAQGAAPATVDALLDRYAKMPDQFRAAGDAAGSLNGQIDKLPKGKKFVFDGTKTMIDAEGRTLTLKDALKGIPPGRTFRFNGKSLVDGRGHAINLKRAIDDIPSPTITPKVDTVPATSGINAIEHRLSMLDGRTTTSYVRVVPKGFIGPVAKDVVRGNWAGGVYKRAAAAGLVQATIAPPGTLYQWAEPRTGGELFVPRYGDRARGRSLLAEGAQWYGMRMVPMAAGGVGVRPAASGLVSVASSSSGASRLDVAEAVLRTRDAVRSLNESLKENGRSFEVSSAKGSANRQALYGLIRAAQDSSRTIFEQTGSVKAANAAFDGYVAVLRRVLAQQRIGSGTVSGLLALAGRPQYGTSGVRDSSANVAQMRAALASATAVGDLRDKLSLNMPGFGLTTEGGRDNITQVLDFLGTAGELAQATFGQTGSASAAKVAYGRQLFQLKRALLSNGYPAKTINDLIGRFGKITLTSNAAGGAYMAAAGVATLDRARIYPAGGRPLYGFAEPRTGGELFLPRNGDRGRGDDLLRIGAGWYGGSYTPAGGGGGGTHSYDYSSHLTVNALEYRPSTAELLGMQRQLDGAVRTGRRR